MELKRIEFWFDGQDGSRYTVIWHPAAKSWDIWKDEKEAIGSHPDITNTIKNHNRAKQILKLYVS